MARRVVGKGPVLGVMALCLLFGAMAIGGCAGEGEDAGTLQVGDAVSLGAFEQDGNFGNGPEAIAWEVLEVDADSRKVLLISEKSLYTAVFNSSVEKGNDWETSELRAWLVGDFATEAFSPEERDDLMGDPFLLSVDEAREFFSTDELRVCEPTAYARSLDAYVAGGPGCAWWLRTPGEQWYTVARVLPDGSIWTYGDEVIGNCGGVRPAVWVALSSLRG